MTVVGETYVKVRPDLAGFGGTLSTEVAASSRKAGVVAGREAGIGFSQGFRSALKTGAALIAVTSVFEGIKASVSAAAEHTGEIQLLDRAIANAGASNTLYGDSVEDVIRKEALQKGFIDEELYPAFSRLVQVTHSSRKAYTDLGLAEDVARQRHIGVSIAALALAKAEQGSVTSLQRLGIILPKHVRDLSGAAKATAALEVVQARFGGSAASFATSEAGNLARFSEARHVIEEAVGGALAPEIAHVADVTANWTSKSENLAKVEREVAAAGQVVAGTAHAIGVGFHVVEGTLGPVVRLLGGVEKTTELAFGALAVRKAQVWGKAILASGTVAAAGETEATAATSAYTAALVANTVALEANAAVQASSVAGLIGAGAAARYAAPTLGVISGEAAVAKTGFLSLGLSAGGAASVLKSGVAPAAVIAGYELSTFIRKIPGWNSDFESLGSNAERLAEKLGLIGSANTTIKIPTNFGQDIQTKLIEAYKKAAAAAPITVTVPAHGRQPARQEIRQPDRDAIVAALVGPGYTFHDAQVSASYQQHFQRGQQGAGARRNYDPAAAEAAAKAGRPTDVDYQIQLQEALATKATADEEALYKSRLAYVTKRVEALKNDTNLTADQKKNLLRLETEQASLQSAITSIDETAAQNAKDAAAKAHQAYTDLLSARGQILQNNAQRAQLTQLSFTDDLKAARAQLAFDRKESNDRKLTAQERAQFASQAIGDESRIQSINQQIHDRETQSYAEQLTLTEQRLQLAAKRAELTGKSIADDKAAARKLIAFYVKESHDAKLTEAQRLQFASQAIDERIALKNLSGQQQGATAQQIFSEAASEFATYGSNIAGRSGVLSGQDARASLGHRLLGGGNPGVDLAIRVAAQQRSAQLSESQKQTALLSSIDRRLGGTDARNRPSAHAIRTARRTAQIVGG